MIEAHVTFDQERDPDRTPDGWKRITVDEVFVGPDGQVAILGPPPSEPEDASREWYENGHNCDEMGCGSLSHVVIHARIERPWILQRHAANLSEGEGDG